MFLNDTYRTVLAAAAPDAELSDAEIAKRTGIPTRTVKGILSDVLEQGIAIRYPLVNTYALGLTPYSVYLSLNPDSATAERDACLQGLAASPVVSFLAEVGGAYQHVVTVLATSPHKVTELLDQVANQFPGILAAKAISAQTTFTFYPGRGLKADHSPQVGITWGLHPAQNSLDAQEFNLLKALISNPGLSRSDFAKRLRQPLSALNFRMQRLRQRGVLAGTVLIINSHQAGNQRFKLMVYTNGVQPSVADLIDAFCRTEPRVTTNIRTLARWDFEIGVEVAESSEAFTIADTLSERLGKSLRNIEVLPHFNDIKLAVFPFQTLEQLIPPVVEEARVEDDA